MLSKDEFQVQPLHIGAEQEFCIVDADGYPSKKALSILEKINDEHFTTELALFNLEINLDPFELDSDCLKKMEEQLDALLKHAKGVAKDQDSKVVLTGILPNISSRHLSPDFMTPSPRYAVLNEMMRELRGQDFSMHIMGVDELTIEHDSVLFEACNTSFQMHLQIEPNDFVASYNWAQAISGPLLAISTNSPILLGKELWKETRIALFQQSIDTRTPSNSVRSMEPRVTFGDDWIYDSIADIYKDDIAKFQIIINREIKDSSSELHQKGIMPKLEALSLHNGTVYRWNRPCYGVHENIAHLRIENRYIPSGPTVKDEIANLALWVGLMKGRPNSRDHINEEWSFKNVRSNFYQAARYGLHSIFNWGDDRISAADLMKSELIPIARNGLSKIGLSTHEIDRYMNVILDRIENGTGADWMVSNYRNGLKQFSSDRVLLEISREMESLQNTDLHVGKWPIIDWVNLKSTRRGKFVYEIMSTHLFTVQESDSASLVSKIMEWKDIHHVPVEDDQNRLAGLLTWNVIKEHLESGNDSLSVGDIMVSKVRTVEKDDTISNASDLMISNEIGCLPVIKDGKLIGIVTKKDLINHGKSTQ